MKINERVRAALETGALYIGWAMIVTVGTGVVIFIAALIVNAEKGVIFSFDFGGFLGAIITVAGALIFTRWQVNAARRELEIDRADRREGEANRLKLEFERTVHTIYRTLTEKETTLCVGYNQLCANPPTKGEIEANNEAVIGVFRLHVEMVREAFEVDLDARDIAIVKTYDAVLGAAIGAAASAGPSVAKVLKAMATSKPEVLWEYVINQRSLETVADMLMDAVARTARTINHPVSLIPLSHLPEPTAIVEASSAR